MDLPQQELRLCDDNGLVSNTPVEPGSPGTALDPSLTYLITALDSGLTYLILANTLRSHTGLVPVDEFHCTGSMHAAGMLFICTSPAHKQQSLQTSVITNSIDNMSWNWRMGY